MDSSMPETDTLIKTTCPRDCYDACGISVRVRDGVIQNVMGDREPSCQPGKALREMRHCL